MVPLERPVIDFAIGSATCVLLDNGDVRCWGGRIWGENGAAHTERLGDDEVPAEIPAVDLGGDPIVELAVGDGHVCALASNRNLRCWGHNMYGQLGYGHMKNIGDDEVPADGGVVPYQ